MGVEEQRIKPGEAVKQPVGAVIEASKIAGAPEALAGVKPPVKGLEAQSGVLGDYSSSSGNLAENTGLPVASVQKGVEAIAKGIPAGDRVADTGEKLGAGVAVVNKPPQEAVVLDHSSPIDPENKQKTIAGVKPFEEKLLGALEKRGYTTGDSIAIQMAIQELAPDIANHAMAGDLKAKAVISDSQCRLELQWRQEGGEVKLEDIAAQRKAEIENVTSPDDYKKSLQGRIEAKEAEGQLGGAGLGLMLVKEMNDDFTTTYDPKTKTYTAVVIKNNSSAPQPAAPVVTAAGTKTGGSVADTGEKIDTGIKVIVDMTPPEEKPPIYQRISNRGSMLERVRSLNQANKGVGKILEGINSDSAEVRSSAQGLLTEVFNKKGEEELKRTGKRTIPEFTEQDFVGFRYDKENGVLYDSGSKKDWAAGKTPFRRLMSKLYHDNPLAIDTLGGITLYVGTGELAGGGIALVDGAAWANGKKNFDGYVSHEQVHRGLADPFKGYRRGGNEAVEELLAYSREVELGHKTWFGVENLLGKNYVEEYAKQVSPEMREQFKESLRIKIKSAVANADLLQQKLYDHVVAAEFGRTAQDDILLWTQEGSAPVNQPRNPAMLRERSFKMLRHMLASSLELDQFNKKANEVLIDGKTPATAVTEILSESVRIRQQEARTIRAGTPRPEASPSGPLGQDVKTDVKSPELERALDVIERMYGEGKGVVVPDEVRIRGESAVREFLKLLPDVKVPEELLRPKGEGEVPPEAREGPRPEVPREVPREAPKPRPRPRFIPRGR